MNTPYDEIDLGTCAYYARTIGLPGADPKATCSFGCHWEPACCADEPVEGWPSVRPWRRDNRPPASKGDQP